MPLPLSNGLTVVLLIICFILVFGMYPLYFSARASTYWLSVLERVLRREMRLIMVRRSRDGVEEDSYIILNDSTQRGEFGCAIFLKSSS